MRICVRIIVLMDQRNDAIAKQWKWDSVQLLSIVFKYFKHAFLAGLQCICELMAASRQLQYSIVEIETFLFRAALHLHRVHLSWRANTKQQCNHSILASYMWYQIQQQQEQQ
jgi:hypothetical protein